MSLCEAHRGVFRFTKKKTVNQAVVQTSSQRESVRQLLAVYLTNRKRKLLRLKKEKIWQRHAVLASSYLFFLLFLEKPKRDAPREFVLQSVNESADWFGGLPLQIAIMRL